MSSYFVKEFVLPKYDSKYKQNILLDMAEFESRFRKKIRDLRCIDEEGNIVVIYYVDY